MGKSKSKRRAEKLAAAIQKRRDKLTLQVVMLILIIITSIAFYALIKDRIPSL